MCRTQHFPCVSVISWAFFRKTFFFFSKFNWQWFILFFLTIINGATSDMIIFNIGPVPMFQVKIIILLIANLNDFILVKKCEHLMFIWIENGSLAYYPKIFLRKKV